MNTANQLKITCLVEDTSPKRPFWGEHGLSFLIEVDGRKLLFDTGWSGDVLLHNLERIGVSLEEIEALFLSHSHDDHTGGLHKIADYFATKPVYCASDVFSEYMPHNLENQQKLQNIIYLDHDTEIFPGVMAMQESAGAYSPKPTNEVNLVINLENKGLVVVVGCSHHGLENILQNAKNAFPNVPIYALIGGFHLKDSNEGEIDGAVNLFKNENIQLLLPDHCTGFRAIQRLISEMPEYTEIIQKADTGTFYSGKVVEI